MTKETLPWGGVNISQGRHGYRFSIDAPILAHHVSLASGQVGVDLGTGCGVIALLVANRLPDATVYAIEIQDELAELASQNVRANRMADRVRIVRGDVKDARSLLGAEVADVVFTNPPYRSAGSGRLSPNLQRTLAKHEVSARLSDVISAARILLKPSGCLWMIYPAKRLVDVMTQMRAFRLEPKALRFIHSRPGAEAQRVLVQARKNGKPGVSVMPALVTHEAEGDFTEEMCEILNGGS